jgi:ribosomal protein L40E
MVVRGGRRRPRPRHDLRGHLIVPAPDPGLREQAGVRTGLRIGGAIALGAGIVLAAVALIDFVTAFGSFEQPRNFWMGFVGLPLIAIGSALLKAGYIGPASRYVAGELAPTVRDGLGALGLTGARSCSSCGAANDADATFCDACGAALSRMCPSCGAANDADARFCDGCGTSLTSS